MAAAFDGEVAAFLCDRLQDERDIFSGRGLYSTRRRGIRLFTIPNSEIFASPPQE
jgi:hypothetical protein